MPWCVDNPDPKIKKPPIPGGSLAILITSGGSAVNKPKAQGPHYAAATVIPPARGCARQLCAPNSKISPTPNRLWPPRNFSLSIPPFRTRSACRRDSACCNVCGSGHEIWRRPPLSSLCCVSSPTTHWVPAVAGSPASQACVVSRLLKFCCVRNRLDRSSCAGAAFVRAPSQDWFLDRSNCGHRGVHAADAAREGAYDGCLGTTNALSF
jgi:hypothetical protein